MICPKCGFEQPDSAECARCGIIFSRYRPPAAARPAPAQGPAAPAPASTPPPPTLAAPAIPAVPALPALPATRPWFEPPASTGPPGGADPPAFAAGQDALSLLPPPAAPSGTLYDGAAAGTAGAGPEAAAGPGAGGRAGIPASLAPAGGGAEAGRPAPPPPFASVGQGAAGRVMPPPPFASVAASARAGSFTVGDILGEVFATYFGNFVPFVLVAGIALLPMLVLALMTTRVAGSPPVVVLLLVGMAGAALIGQEVATGAVTFGVLQEMRRREASVLDCLRGALAVLLPILGVALLAGLAIFVGAVFCFAPGVILAVMFNVAVPAAVEERPGVVEALRRSVELTAGFRWQIFGVLAVLGFLQLGIRFVLGLIPALSPGAAPLAGLLSAAFQVVGTGIGATASAVMYYRLRSIKEAIDVREIVSVFD